jgi:hypothetical protein
MNDKWHDLYLATIVLCRYSHSAETAKALFGDRDDVETLREVNHVSRMKSVSGMILQNIVIVAQY